MADSAGAKHCVICGRDCSGVPRVRDGRGRYACRSCLEHRKRRRSPEHAEPVRSSAELEFLQGVKAPEQPGINCPGCGRRLPLGHVLCMSCGTNAETGTQAETNVRLQRPKPARATPASIGIGAASSACAAAGGLLAWYLSNRTLGEPTLAMTMLVGAMAGIGMTVPIRGSGRLATGLIAAGCAAGMILIGLVAFDPGEAPDTFEYLWFSADSFLPIPEMVEVENLGEDEYVTAGVLWFALGCCAAFALGASNPDSEGEDAEGAA